jgi:hypothetical protein
VGELSQRDGVSLSEEISQIFYGFVHLLVDHRMTYNSAGFLYQRNRQLIESWNLDLRFTGRQSWPDFRVEILGPRQVRLPQLIHFAQFQRSKTAKR